MKHSFVKYPIIIFTVLALAFGLLGITRTQAKNNLANTAPKVVGLADGTSGVFGDSTSPVFSGTSGFPFTVSDAETALSALSVVISNNAPSRVTATLVTVNASLGQYRLDFGAPLSASGIAIITVTVTDGSGATGSDTFQYGVSAYDATRPNARYNTGAADASTTFAIDTNYMIVGNDEDQVLRVYDRNNSGAPVTQVDYTSLLNLTDADSSGVLREVDIEGSAFNGSTLYIIGSHDNKSDGSTRPNRSRLFGVTVSGTGAATTFSFNGYYQYLKADLIAWDNANGHGLGAKYLGLQASAASGVIPEQVNGFNIEGLTFAPGSTSTLYIGFRAPLEPTSTRTKGLIVPITNGSSLLGKSSGSAVFGAPIQLDLGGRGIRSIECNTSGCLIMAGNAISGGNFALYRWTGNPANAPVLTTTDLTDGSGFNPGLAPEGLIIPDDVNAVGGTIQIVSDNGDTDWYLNGTAAKDLPIAAHKKSRSDYITIGADVPLPTATPTQTATRTRTSTAAPATATPTKTKTATRTSTAPAVTFTPTETGTPPGPTPTPTQSNTPLPPTITPTETSTPTITATVPTVTSTVPAPTSTRTKTSTPISGPSLIISEVSPWSSGNSPVAADWFEVTNIGSSAVNITGWKMDDSSNSFGSAVALSGITSIAPGESVIFVEGSSSIISTFKSVWFGANPPAGLQIGIYSGSNVSLSASGDAVNLYNSSGALQANVVFGASPSGPSFPSFDNAAGLNNATISQLSVAGVNGAFIAAGDSNEIGSPGKIVN